MSTGPRMMVSTRGDAAQISSQLISPRAVSIWASMPMCRWGSPALASTWERRRSRAGALPSIFSLEAGTERQERRGRLRVRSDMYRAYGRGTISAQLGAQELERADPGLARGILVVGAERVVLVGEGVPAARVEVE